MSPTIGILALQGDFEAHARSVNSLGIAVTFVKTARDLSALDALIIPGGESTTMTKLIAAFDLHNELVSFAQTRPVMGTCAGMIMLSSQVEDSRVRPLGAIDISVDRNAYGSQKESFETDILLPDEFSFGSSAPFRAVFIRAPRVASWNKKTVTPLLFVDNIPVLFRQNNVLALAFHPELTDDNRIHRYFIEKTVLPHIS